MGGMAEETGLAASPFGALVAEGGVTLIAEETFDLLGRSTCVGMVYAKGDRRLVVFSQTGDQVGYGGDHSCVSRFIDLLMPMAIEKYGLKSGLHAFAEWDKRRGVASMIELAEDGSVVWQNVAGQGQHLYAGHDRVFDLRTKVWGTDALALPEPGEVEEVDAEVDDDLRRIAQTLQNIRAARKGSLTLVLGQLQDALREADWLLGEMVMGRRELRAARKVIDAVGEVQTVEAGAIGPDLKVARETMFKAYDRYRKNYGGGGVGRKPGDCGEVYDV